MPWPKNRNNSLSCSAWTSLTKVVLSKGWLSDERMDALQGVWRGLEPTATPSPQSHHLSIYLYLLDVYELCNVVSMVIVVMSNGLRATGFHQVHLYYTVTTSPCLAHQGFKNKTMQVNLLYNLQVIIRTIAYLGKNWIRIILYFHSFILDNFHRFWRVQYKSLLRYYLTFLRKM